MQQALREGAVEALMENHRGELCECAQSNIFFVRDGVLLTPPIDAGLLVGVTRQFVLEVAAGAGVAAEERVLRRADLASMDEAFLTSTTKAIVPVVQVGDVRIGPGVPGPTTRRLMDAFEDAIPSRLS
jgi:branched-chain amino acid aminotransferase